MIDKETETNSCGSCRWFNQQNEDYGYCMYPIPAWLILRIVKHMRISAGNAVELSAVYRIATAALAARGIEV